MLKFKWIKRVQYIYDGDKVYKIDYSNKGVIVVYAKVNNKFVMKHFVNDNHSIAITPYNSKDDTTIPNYILVGLNKIAN